MNDQFDQTAWVPPAREPNQGFVTASLILGILTVMTAVMMTVYIPFILGGISIILAILSKGKLPRLPKMAQKGIIISIAGIILNIVIVVGSFYTVFHNPQARAEFDTMFEQVYGESFDEMVQDIQNGNYVLEEY